MPLLLLYVLAVLLTLVFIGYVLLGTGLLLDNDRLIETGFKISIPALLAGLAVLLTALYLELLQ